MDRGGSTDNLWLARALFELGGVEFGSFTLGRTAVNSPIFLNPSVLISDPQVLQKAASLIAAEATSASVRRKPRIESFDLVAGVPFGGLHLATIFSVQSGVPMIYVRPPRMGGLGNMIEGRYDEDQTVLIVDDLITGGSSILQTASLLEESELRVRDVVVLIDREQGATDRLKRHGLRLTPILRLTVMLQYYRSMGMITQDQFDLSMQYLEDNRSAADAPFEIPPDPSVN